MAKSQCFPYRPHDYMYDPLFTVSGEADQHKAALIAKMSIAKFQICPVFPNMFSTLPRYPRKQLVRRESTSIEYPTKLPPKTKDPVLQKRVEVSGKDRAIFFKYPIVNIPNKIDLPYQTLDAFYFQKVEKAPKIVGAIQSVSTQTKYRDSEAQTIPWEPPHVLKGVGDPEVLKLTFLKWESGLPAGMREVEIIERARMKRAWEQALHMSAEHLTLSDLKEFVNALERDEWAFREKEIQDIQDLRLKLLEEMLNELHMKSNERTEIMINNLIQRKEKEKQEKLAKLKKDHARAKRKLDAEERGENRRYHAVGIIEEHVNKKSELYGPLTRHGSHPKRWHYDVNEKLRLFKAQYIGIEDFSTLPRWLDRATNVRERKMKKLPGTRLCMRETKWTAPVLRQLHEELKNLGKVDEKKKCNLRVRNEKPPPPIYTPEVEGIPQSDEDAYQAVILMQSIIKGRAAQTLIYEGRDRCRQLIHELKSTEGLLKSQKQNRLSGRLKVKQQQRDEFRERHQVNRLHDSLGQLQGKIVGTLLDFLNKELRKLLMERKAHALCLLNERERYKREAEEAGRRQYELRRRREHDEMFKQIVKVNQDTVDLYLQDIITEGTEFTSEEEAKKYVEDLARKIDQEVEEFLLDENKEDEEDESIANLFHHFLLPEVEKRLVRKNMEEKQKDRLKSVQEIIYGKLETLPKPIIEPEESKASSSVKEENWEKGLLDYLQSSGYPEVEESRSIASSKDLDYISAGIVTESNITFLNVPKEHELIPLPSSSTHYEQEYEKRSTILEIESNLDEEHLLETTEEHFSYETSSVSDILQDINLETESHSEESV